MAVIIVFSDMEQEAKVRSCTGLNRLNQRVHGFNPSKISDINWSTYAYVCPHIARKNAESAPPKAHHHRAPFDHQAGAARATVRKAEDGDPWEGEKEGGKERAFPKGCCRKGRPYLTRPPTGCIKAIQS